LHEELRDSNPKSAQPTGLAPIRTQSGDSAASRRECRCAHDSEFDAGAHEHAENDEGATTRNARRIEIKASIVGNEQLLSTAAGRGSGPECAQ
jgi:hypothetical protein